MTLSSQILDVASGISLKLSSIPHLLWQYYLEYLIFYEPTSWVGRIAHSFRLLAIIFIMPMVFISLLVRTSLYFTFNFVSTFRRMSPRMLSHER
jgi:hypothetical protein